MRKNCLLALLFGALLLMAPGGPLKAQDDICGPSEQCVVDSEEFKGEWEEAVLGDYDYDLLDSFDSEVRSLEGGQTMLMGGGILGSLVHTASYPFPCEMGFDPCTGDYRLALGYGWGGLDIVGDKFGTVTALHGNLGCGWGEYTAQISDGKHLVLHWPGAIAYDLYDFGNGAVRFRIYVYRAGNAACGGTQILVGSDIATCTPNNSIRDWVEAYGDGRGNCEGSYGDPTPCHLPDVLLLNPGTNATRHYRYQMFVDHCDENGDNCSWFSQDTGCFTLQWVN